MKGTVSENAATSPSHPANRLNIFVGIATRGRAEILIDTIADLYRQQRAADRILVAYADPSDIGDARERFPAVVFIKSELGLTRQRNAILNHLDGADLLVFIDDDFYLDGSYLAVAERFFLDKPEVAVATGRVLADGINGPGLTYAEAREILDAAQKTESARARSVFNAYGCNMCLRAAPIIEHNLGFDEQLPFYGWYEDVDFSRQLARFGTVMSMPNALGVHLGVKGGRTSGVRLGYSQVANPIYLFRKGTFPFSHLIYSITVRFLKNMVKCTRPEPWVDRRGRTRGNLLGFRDLALGKLHPLRVHTL